jgi:hypothetical protein
MLDIGTKGRPRSEKPLAYHRRFVLPPPERGGFTGK